MREAILETNSASLSGEDREAFVDTVRRLFEARSDEAAVRRVMETESGYDPALWREMAELGILGLIVPERLGGTGLGALELELVMEEAGAALLCSPFFASSVLAAALLQAVGSDDHLAEIAAGETIVTAALTGPAGNWTEAGVAVSAQNDKLSGCASYVLDAVSADVFLVAARNGSDIAIYELAANSPGVTIHPLPTFDRTRRMVRIEFDGTTGKLIGKGWGAVEQALNVARIALAGEQAGGSREIFQRTVNYIKERYQFGRAVGGFQALKHMSADLLLECEAAISAARNAAAQYDAGSDDVEAAIALASFACADAYVKTSADAIQMHGGIGFTWEHPAHLFLRRARADSRLLGDSAHYRELFVQTLEH